jgi:hypothetical protein
MEDMQGCIVGGLVALQDSSVPQDGRILAFQVQRHVGGKPQEGVRRFIGLFSGEFVEGDFDGFPDEAESKISHRTADGGRGFVALQA